MWDEYLAVWKICLPLHPQSREKARIKEWCGSSAWLEYMPVTHGVAGSSPVRTAKPAKLILQALFFIINGKAGWPYYGDVPCFGWCNLSDERAGWMVK